MTVDMTRPEFRLAHAIRQAELGLRQYEAAERDGLAAKAPSVAVHIDGEVRGLQHALAILVGEREGARILREYDAGGEAPSHGEGASTAKTEPDDDADPAFRTHHWATGKTDGSLGPIRHTSREAAEAWIAERERIDPEGVVGGAYYLDAPEPDDDDPPSQGDAATTATDAARDVAHRLAGFMAGDLFDLMDERDIDGAAWLTVEEQDTGRRFTVAVREEASA